MSPDPTPAPHGTESECNDCAPDGERCKNCGTLGGDADHECEAEGQRFQQHSGRPEPLPDDIAAGARWMADREAGAICNVDCGCACHDAAEAAPCVECCTPLEAE